jgi:hypothetical protein
MSAKVCLFCGKTLSRIWSGAGEDFCSREHRNQYRLRRGMDRLHEANKVANVMRRRENPRQIATGSLINPGGQSARGYLQHRTPAGRLDPALAVQHKVSALRPHMDTTAGAFPAPAVGSASSKDRQGTYTSISFPIRRASTGRAISPRMPARVSQAPLVPVGGRPDDVPCPRRVLLSAWKPPARTILGNMLQRVRPPELNPMDANRTAGRLLVPSEGRALRVSLGAGFQIPKREFPQIAIEQPQPAGLTWPVMINLSEGALEQRGPEPMVEGISISVPGMRIPAAPPLVFDSRFRWPGVFELPLHYASPVIRHRTAFVPFGNADEGPGKEYFNEYRN